jgi:ADP-ribosylglycohydrolase
MLKESSSKVSMELLRTRAESGLKTLYVADALAMPVHWYYRPYDIQLQFPGGITDFEAAPNYHPSSIMSLHSTNGGGRRSKESKNQKEIIGDVILKGKRNKWGIANTHYHQGMPAGSNTLNAHCARAVTRSLTANSAKYSQDAFIESYISLLTSDPPKHPDTYAESYHRAFFANFENGVPPQKCGAKTHDTASIGGLVTLAPIVISERFAGTSLEATQRICMEHLWLTHPDKALAQISSDYVSLLDALLFRNEQQKPHFLKEFLSKQFKNLNFEQLEKKARDGDEAIVGQLFSTACYISDSWPSVLYLAYRYHVNILDGLISNTNLGGDNVHRGSVLGVLLGIANAKTVDSLFNKLVDNKIIHEEIKNLLDTALSRCV